MHVGDWTTLAEVAAGSSWPAQTARCEPLEAASAADAAIAALSTWQERTVAVCGTAPPGVATAATWELDDLARWAPVLAVLDVRGRVAAASLVQRLGPSAEQLIGRLIMAMDWPAASDLWDALSGGRTTGTADDRVVPAEQDGDTLQLPQLLAQWRWAVAADAPGTIRYGYLQRRALM